jgi:hypothetical protein
MIMPRKVRWAQRVADVGSAHITLIGIREGKGPFVEGLGMEYVSLLRRVSNKRVLEGA